MLQRPRSPVPLLLTGPLTPTLSSLWGDATFRRPRESQRVRLTWKDEPLEVKGVTEHLEKDASRAGLEVPPGQELHELHQS